MPPPTIQTLGLPKAGRESRKKAELRKAVLVLLATPLRSNSLSGYSPHVSQRYHHDWSTSHLPSFQGERGLALNNTMCGKAHDTELVLEVAIRKTSLSALQTDYSHKTHLWFWVHETLQQGHNCCCVFLMLKNDIYFRFFSKASGDSPAHVPVAHSPKCYVVFKTTKL